MRSVILTKTLKRWGNTLFGYLGEENSRQKRTACTKTQRWEHAWHAQGSSARGRRGSEDVSELRDTVGHVSTQGHSWGRRVVSIITCFLDKLLNSHLSSKEEYLLLTFSQITYFYFWQSLHIFFLTSLFFPQSLKFFRWVLSEKILLLSVFFFFLICDAKCDPDNSELSYQYKGRGTALPVIPQHTWVLCPGTGWGDPEKTSVWSWFLSWILRMSISDWILGFRSYPSPTSLLQISSNLASIEERVFHLSVS